MLSCMLAYGKRVELRIYQVVFIDAALSLILSRSAQRSKLIKDRCNSSTDDAPCACCMQVVCHQAVT